MDTKEYIEQLVKKARAAQAIYAEYDQAGLDKVTKAAGKAIYDHGKELAYMAVDESHMGDKENKVGKNCGKSMATWAYLKDKKSTGVIAVDDTDPKKKMITIAKPVGVIAAITPVTNPVMTPMHNAMIALKSGNAIIVFPHPSGKQTGYKTCEYMREAIKAVGAPEDLVQAVAPEFCNIDASGFGMSLCDVVLATGGPGMVKAAYSSGKPSYGVGAGNMQCVVDEDVDPAVVAPKILTGRTWDNGLLCTCEQGFIAHEKIYDKLVEELGKIGAFYVADPAMVNALRDLTMPGGELNKKVVGLPATKLAEMIGLEVPATTKALIAPACGTGAKDPFSKEKLFPVLGAFKCKTWEEGIQMAIENLLNMGAGHSTTVHSMNDDHVLYAGLKLPVSRVLVNGVGSLGVGGAVANRFVPTGTLGCGTWGGNSVSGNITYTHLMNTTTIGYTDDTAKPFDPAVVWAD